MTTHHLLRSAGLAALLLASFAAPSATFAQDPTIGGVRDRAPAARVARTRPRVPAEDILGRPQPRYRVEAVSFLAVEESPPELLGSDEVYAVFYDPGRDTIAITATVGGVDSGERYVFKPHESCIAPLQGGPVIHDSWSCGPGIAAPLTFEIALFDEDDTVVRPCRSNDTHRDYVLNGKCRPFDGLIGYASVELAPSDLNGWLREPGASFTREQDLEARCPPFVPCFDKASYRLRYRITRVEDYAPDQPLVAGRR